MAICRALLERGYLKATEGNVSVRVPGRDLFAITPSNYDYAKMQRRRHLRARLRPAPRERHDEGVDRGGHARRGLPGAPRRERHHPHPPALRERPGSDAPAHPGAVRRAGALPGARRGDRHYAPSGTSFLKSRVKAKLQNGDNAYILANHGVLVLGGDTERAMHNMALLEKVALDYLLTLLTGEKAATMPLPIREIAFAKLRADQKKLAAPGGRGGRRGRDRARDGAVGRRPTAPRGAAAPADRRSAAAAEPAAAAPAGRGRAADQQLRRSAATPTWRPCTAGLERLVEPAAAQAQAAAMQEYLDYFETKCARSKALTGRGHASTSPAACSTTSRSTTRSRSRSSRPRAPTSGTSTATATSTSCRPAGRPCWAATTRRCATRSSSCCSECGPVTGLFHEYELKLAELVNRFMPAVEMFRMLGSRHRGGDGGDPRGARVHRQEVGHQGRRRLSRLERPDGLRPARARHLALRGAGHPVRRHRRARGRSTRTTSTRCAASCAQNRLLGRHRGGDRRAGRARRAARGRCPSTTTRRCASCATSSARC